MNNSVMRAMCIGLSGAKVDAVKINRVLLSVSDKTGNNRQNVVIFPFIAIIRQQRIYILRIYTNSFSFTRTYFSE